ncbi:MAG: hypothetical protein U0930_11275 [Pirellulales bacterium]
MRPSVSIAELFALTAISAVAISTVKWITVEPYTIPYLLIAGTIIRLTIRRAFRCSRGLRDFLIGWIGTTSILLLMILFATSRNEPGRWMRDMADGLALISLLHAIGVSTLVEMLLPSWLTVREAI